VNKKFFAADRELRQGKISGSRTQAECRTSKSEREPRQKGKNNFGFKKQRNRKQGMVPL